MEWNKIPVLLRIVIVIGVIFLTLWILDLINKNIETVRSDIKEKLRKTQMELQGLITERKRIQRMIMKVQSYVEWTLRALRLFLVCIFVGFIFFLVQLYGMDLFTAVGTAGAFVGTIYMIIVWLLNSKINNLKELEEKVSKAVEQFYSKRLNVIPARLVAVDERIILLENRTREIQLKLEE